MPGSDVSTDQEFGSGTAPLDAVAESDSVTVTIAFKPEHFGRRAFPPSVPGQLLDPPDMDVVKREEERLLQALDGDVGAATPEQLQQLEEDIVAGIRAIPQRSTEPCIPSTSRCTW